MLTRNRPVLGLSLMLLLSSAAFAAVGDADEPVRYIGENNVSNSGYKDGYHDGQMQVAIGTQNYQILRANRSHPEWSDGLGWTYNHAPMLAYANGQFYCQYLNNVTGEHIPPGVTMLTRSSDGKHWTRPQVLFPIYFTADPNDASITFKFMHQRMGFYAAPNGRFLTMGFYGSPYGDGVGRVVREIYPDDSFGPIYFIRVNDNWTGEVKYPLYTASDDEGFVEACRSFLDDKVRRVQWWEEDRFAKDRDEFYRVCRGDDVDSDDPAKAFCFYTRPDGAIVGFFKSRWVTMTRDQGQTWSPLVQCDTLTYGGAKIWAQKLDNGRYALVYNPTGTPARHPLSIATSDDGVLFDHLVNVHSELPPKRCGGRQRRPGPQYVRGIIEGNGNPPGDDLWVVYSVSKEDIWISRVPVPVQHRVQDDVRDDFSQMETGGVIENWNIYSPQWCPVEVVEFPGAAEKSMRLKDTDPYDYAKAVRVFKNTPLPTVLSFEVYLEATDEVLDIEVVSARGNRLVQTRLNTDRSFMVKYVDKQLSAVTKLDCGLWYKMDIRLDTPKRKFSIMLNGEPLIEKAGYSADGIPERIVFRTGSYRLTDDVEHIPYDGQHPGTDKPGADEPVQPGVYYIRDFGAASAASVLQPERFRHYVETFNQIRPEAIVNAVPDAEAWTWMKDNIPLFECPDKTLEAIYYYRWWTFRKHLKKTPDGHVFTEFLDNVGHSGKYNTISCAIGHHVYEGTWLRNPRYIDEYARFWFTGNDGGLQRHLHKYSNWAPASLYRRFLVNQDKAFLISLLDAFVKDYETWEQEKQLESGLFWQYDVRDAMEESISGSRTVKNARPPLNCYLYGNAAAISRIAEMAGNETLSKEYAQKAAELKSLVQALLWDEQARFFKVRHPDGGLSDVREQIGYIPWYFNLPESGYEQAWQQLTDPQGFKAPVGITTAERRHPEFRSHGVGTCEWDGAVWPFATSQTLTALANLLRNYEQPYVSKEDYFEALLTYARSHAYEGRPYISEYHDEITGEWLKPDSKRSRYYNHSTFCDLVITGPVGLVPRADNIVEVDPLLPAGVWDWFCLDRVSYHGKMLTILWDRTGQKYGKGQGLRIFADGEEIGSADDLSHLTCRLP